MKTRGYVDYLRITGILVSVTTILASSSAYNLYDNADRSYSSIKTADGQEQGFEEQENSIDENSVTTNNINSSELSLPELFSKVEKSYRRERPSNVSRW